MSTEQTPSTAIQSTAQGGAVAKKLEPADRVRSLLNSVAIKEKFNQVLGAKAPAFMSSVISAVSANKALAACEPMSVVSSAAIAAAMDLPINASLGFAYIVPYKQKDGTSVAQFQIGWKGFVQLAMRSGQYKTINLTPVFEGQVVDHNQFTGEMKFRQERISEKHEGYLLYFKLLNGYEKYFYMTGEECFDHGKRYSKSFGHENGQWRNNFEAMALKTVAKLGLSKYGILSIDMQQALEYDQAAVAEDGSPVYIDAPPQTDATKDPVKKTTRLAKVVEAASAQAAAHVGTSTSQLTETAPTPPTSAPAPQEAPI